MKYTANQELRVLTLRQPYASLVAWGEKQHETRTGNFPKYTGWVAIHAAAGIKDELTKKNETYLLAALERHGWPTTVIPRAMVLCVVWFDKAEFAVETKRRLEGLNRHAEIAFGDYSVTRRAIAMYHLQLLPKPIEWRGAQGLRIAPLDLREQIAHQLAP